MLCYVNNVKLRTNVLYVYVTMLQMMFVVLQMTELSYDRRRFLHLRKTRFNRSQLVKNNVNELHAFFFFTDIYKGETFTVDF